MKIGSIKTCNFNTTSGNEDYVYPNVAEGMEAKLRYIIDESVRVKPGDTFTLKLSQNVDLFGLNDNTENGNRAADIYGPMGRIAVAKIRDDRKTIDYTFTEAIQPGDKITNLSINTPMFIDRYKILNNTKDVQITIKVGDGNNAVFTDKISVNYDDTNGYGYINDRVNVKTYITEFEPTTGYNRDSNYIKGQYGTTY